MKKEDVPFYNDPEDFNENSTYPCDTQYMTYNPLLHRYTLTAQGLIYYGVDADRYYMSTDPNKVAELADKASKKVYDTIQYLSGRNRYQVQMYRIATAPKTIYPDQYYMRKQFEEALAEQARYICTNGDRTQFSNASMEKDTATIRPEDRYRDLNDISPESMRILDTLGLTRWFQIIPKIRLDLDKY